MEAGLANATLKLYHIVSGNNHYSASDVRNEFTKIVVDKPLVHSSPITGKMPSAKHILEGEIQEESIESILQGIWFETN